MMASALEDEVTRDHGVVWVVWNPQAINLFGSLFDSFWNLFKSLRGAFAISRLHYLTVNNDATYSMTEKQETDPCGHTTVIRHHTGSSQECLHALLTFGLPIPSLPIQHQPHSPIPTEHHIRWVDWRRRTDAYNPQYPLVLVPHRQDIVLGPQKIVGAGNIRFHQMMLSKLDEYASLKKKSERRELCRRIYDSLTIPEGRYAYSPQFLLPLDGGILYEPMDEEAVLKKIADAFGFLQKQQQQSGDKASGSRIDTINGDEGYWELYLKQCYFAITCKDGYRVCD